MVLLLYALIPVAIIFAYIGAYFTDFAKILEMIFRFSLFVSPVLWSSDKIPSDLQWIAFVNPLAIIINIFRDILMYNKTSSINLYLLILVIAILLNMIAIKLVNNIGRRVVKVL